MNNADRAARSLLFLLLSLGAALVSSLGMGGALRHGNYGAFGWGCCWATGMGVALIHLPLSSELGVALIRLPLSLLLFSWIFVFFPNRLKPTNFATLIFYFLDNSFPTVSPLAPNPPRFPPRFIAHFLPSLIWIDLRLI